MPKAYLKENQLPIFLNYLESASHIVFCVLDEHFLLQNCNLAYKDLFHLTEKPIGKSIREFLSNQDDISLLVDCTQTKSTNFQKVMIAFSTKMIPSSGLSFSSFYDGESLYLFGEMMIAHENTIIQEFSRLSNQLNNMNRDLNKKNMELEIANEIIAVSDRKLKEQIDKARQIHQRHILTTFPDVSGLSFAAYYMAAETLGGDFYDIAHIGDHVILYLSDVSGHGLDGAMLSVFVKNTISSYLHLSVADPITPEDIINHLTIRYHQENYPDEYFVSIFLAVLDTRTMVMSYLGAGFQNPILVSTGGKEHSAIIAKGLPISSAIPLKFMVFRNEQITLQKDTTMLISTDGLLEQESQGIPYTKRLTDLFYACSHLPAEEIIRTICDDFQEFNEGSMLAVDDLTFFVIKHH